MTLDREKEFSVEDIIDPRDTRKELCAWINLAVKNRKVGPVSFGMRP